MNALQVIENCVYSLKDTFTASLAEPTLKFEAEAGFAIQALMANDYAMKIAASNQQSVINAVTNVAAIGISLNPAKKQAYLVPRDGKICLDISYMGLMELAIASGSIRWAQSHIVYAKDEFQIAGYDRPPEHRYSPFGGDRGDMVGVYVVAKTAEGDFLTHCMDMDAVFAIRERSSAWKAWLEKKKKCPWVTDEAEMVKKTCVKQASKYWPKTDRVAAAIHHVNTDGAEGLAELANHAPPPVDLRAEWADKVRECQSLDELREIGRKGARAFKDAGDRTGFADHSKSVVARAEELKRKAAPEPDPFVIEMEQAEGTGNA